MTGRTNTPMWLRRWVGAAVVALVLVGCSGSGDPEPIPTTPPTSVSTPASPSPTPDDTLTGDPTETSEPGEAGDLPPLPDAAKENTPEGAEAFIRYYFDVANGLYMDPKPGLIPGISDQDCVACQRTETTIRDLSLSNSHARTEPFVITSMERIGGGAPGVQRFNMVAHAPANATVSQDGSESNLGDEATLQGIGAAIWDGNQWKLYDLALEPR